MSILFHPHWWRCRVPPPSPLHLFRFSFNIIVRLMPNKAIIALLFSKGKRIFFFLLSFQTERTRIRRFIFLFCCYFLLLSFRGERSSWQSAKYEYLIPGTKIRLELLLRKAGRPVLTHCPIAPSTDKAVIGRISPRTGQAICCVIDSLICVARLTPHRSPNLTFGAFCRRASPVSAGVNHNPCRTVMTGPTRRVIPIRASFTIFPSCTIHVARCIT